MKVVAVPFDHEQLADILFLAQKIVEKTRRIVSHSKFVGVGHSRSLVRRKTTTENGQSHAADRRGLEIKPPSHTPSSPKAGHTRMELREYIRCPAVISPLPECRVNAMNVVMIVECVQKFTHLFSRGLAQLREILRQIPNLRREDIPPRQIGRAHV